MPYLLDANVFIEARKRWYGFDICPGFWEWLVRANGDGKVFSIERVADEIQAGDDDLVEWARQHGDRFFLKPDAAMLASLSRLSVWATGGFYDQSAVTGFLDSADSYLVAHAHSHGFTVVTHEVVANSPKNVKIPNACIELGVKYMNTFEMLRIEHAQFVLAESA